MHLLYFPKTVLSNYIDAFFFFIFLLFYHIIYHIYISIFSFSSFFFPLSFFSSSHPRKKHFSLMYWCCYREYFSQIFCSLIGVKCETNEKLVKLLGGCIRRNLTQAMWDSQKMEQIG